MAIEVKKDSSNQFTGTSALHPLQERLFRAIWIASVVSNVGTWMQEVGEAWLMTSLTASPVIIGLLATAVTFPMFVTTSDFRTGPLRPVLHLTTQADVRPSRPAADLERTVARAPRSACV